MSALLTPRLQLRPFVLSDAPFIFRLVNEPGWLRFIGDKQVGSVEQAEIYLRDGPMKMYAEEGVAPFMVALRDTDTAVGMCGLVRRASLAHVDLAFAFLESHWSNGYAHEASQAVLDGARDELGLSEVLAITMPENTASCALLVKLGFVYQSPWTSPKGGAALSLYRNLFSKK